MNWSRLPSSQFQWWECVKVFLTAIISRTFSFPILHNIPFFPLYHLAFGLFSFGIFHRQNNCFLCNTCVCGCGKVLLLRKWFWHLTDVNKPFLEWTRSLCRMQWAGEHQSAEVHQTQTVRTSGQRFLSSCWDMRSRLFPHPVWSSALLISAYVIWPVTARGLGRLRRGGARVITLHHLRTPLFSFHLAPLPSLSVPIFLLPPVDTSLLAERRRQWRPLPLWADAIWAFRDTGDASCCPMHLHRRAQKAQHSAHKQCFFN